MSTSRRRLFMVYGMTTVLVCLCLVSCSPITQAEEGSDFDPLEAKMISTAEVIAPKFTHITSPKPPVGLLLDPTGQSSDLAQPSPTPYTFSTACAPCIPTQAAQYTFIRTWEEFEFLNSMGVDKYIYFPVTVLHKLNQVDFLVSWGLYDQRQVIWAQLRKDGHQSTEMIQPGMQLTLYGQVNTRPACTDGLTGHADCFPVIADVIMANY